MSNLVEPALLFGTGLLACLLGQSKRLLDGCRNLVAPGYEAQEPVRVFPIALTTYAGVALNSLSMIPSVVILLIVAQRVNDVPTKANYILETIFGAILGLGVSMIQAYRHYRPPTEGERD